MKTLIKIILPVTVFTFMFITVYGPLMQEEQMNGKAQRAIPVSPNIAMNILMEQFH